MFHPIFAITMLLAIMQAAPPVPGQAANSSRRSSKSLKHDGNSQQTPAPAPTVDDPSKRDPSSNNGRGLAGENKDEPVAISKLPAASVSRDWIDYTALTFNGLLVIVGVGAVFAALRTLRAIKKQAEHMQDQVALMKVPFQQWMVLENWRHEPVLPHWLRIRVEAVNPTQFPMTIKQGNLRLSAGGVNTNYLITEPTFVPPNKPHTIDIEMFVSEDVVQSVLKDFLAFSVDASFTHCGPLGEDVSTRQPLSGMLVCGKAGTKFNPTRHMNPEREQRTDES